MPSILNATTTSGLVTSADNSGSLQLQTNNGTTAVTIDTSQNVGIGTGTTSNGNLTVQKASSTTDGPVLTLWNSNSSAGNTCGYLRFFSNTTVRAELSSVIDSGSPFAGNFIFKTGEGTLTERMRIDSSGNVGIGTSSPSQKLQIVDGRIALTEVYDVRWLSSGGTLRGSVSADSGSNLYFGTGSSNTERMRIDSSGNVLIGRTSTGFNKTAYGWQFSRDAESFGTVNTAASVITFNRNNDGDIFKFFRDGTQQGWISVQTTGTTYGNLSDRRRKENFTASPQALNKLMDVNVQSFDWKDGGHTEFGLVAQELNEVLPFAVTAGDDGDTIEKPWGIDNTKIVPVLIKAIQEQQAQIEELKAEVQALKGAQ